MADKLTFTGTIEEVKSDKNQRPIFVLRNNGKSRTIRASNYEGALPQAGQTIAAEFHQWKPDGAEYAMNFLDGWTPADPATVVSSNGSGSAGGYQPRDDTWTAARWALSTAIESVGGPDLTKKETRAAVDDIALHLLLSSLNLRQEVQKLLVPKQSEAVTEQPVATEETKPVEVEF